MEVGEAPVWEDGDRLSSLMTLCVFSYATRNQFDKFEILVKSIPEFFGGAAETGLRM